MARQGMGGFSRRHQSRATTPYRSSHCRAIVSAAVTEGAKGDVPVTIKMRVGIDEEHHTYLDAATAAVEEGVAAVALHARTASQAYSGTADWTHIRLLKETITSVPVEIEIVAIIRHTTITSELPNDPAV